MTISIAPYPKALRRFTIKVKKLKILLKHNQWGQDVARQLNNASQFSTGSLQNCSNSREVHEG